MVFFDETMVVGALSDDDFALAKLDVPSTIY